MPRSGIVVSLSVLLGMVAGAGWAAATPPDGRPWKPHNPAVERPDYEAAVHGVAACLRGRGVQVAGPAWSPDGRFLLMTYQDDGTSAFARRTASCDTLPEQAVIDAYQQEEIERARSPEAMFQWVECLHRIGLTSASTDADIADLFLLSTALPNHHECPPPGTVFVPAALVDGIDGP